VSWIAVVILTLAGCSGWTGPQDESGPLPLSSADKPIHRLVDKQSSFERISTKVLWDEGKGPVLVSERVKPLVYAVPFVE
jgi:hypothetical protein